MKKIPFGGFLILFLLAGIIWVSLNPFGRFGYHRYGLTVYNGIPFLFVDIKIYENGIPAIRSKSHFVSLNEVLPLIKTTPVTLIIGNGYSGFVEVDKEVLKLQQIDVKILKTPEAIKLFNKLKEKGETVIAIIHSTC